MLTVAYCRVSTEEQAAEGFSIEGQAEKLRAYAKLHDLGEVMVIADPGKSGKDLNRPGLQQLLAMVDADHVTNVLLWRLDRLSRNLGDLIDLADRCGQHNVALHSFTEKIDLSSATGRMFYNIIGTFAQFYREQLAENVRMGTQQAVREGKWVNRPKTGYDLVNGELVANGDAVRVREIFRLRAEGSSYRDISEETGINYSTVASILQSRVYLGEVQLNGEWFPGRHEALVSEAEFAAANRGHVRGRRRGSDLLSGRVFCGLCSKRMAIGTNGEGRELYRCWHRGRGCVQPSRTNRGLHRAALLGLRLLAHDRELQDAIQRELVRTQRPHPRGGRSDGQRPAEALAALDRRRRKLLELYYADQISGELFGEQEREIADGIEAVRLMASREKVVEREKDEIARRYEELVLTLRDLDIDRLWSAATDVERRTLVEELVERVEVHPDHLEVVIFGAPRLNVRLDEVGLGNQSQNVGVGGGTRDNSARGGFELVVAELWLPAA